MKYFLLNYKIARSDFFSFCKNVNDYCSKMDIEISFMMYSGTIIRLIHISEEDMCAMKLTFNGLDFNEVDTSIVDAINKGDIMDIVT